MESIGRMSTIFSLVSVKIQGEMPSTLSLPDQPFIWTKKGRKLVQMGLNMLKMSRFLHLENTFSSLIEAIQGIYATKFI